MGIALIIGFTIVLIAVIRLLSWSVSIMIEESKRPPKNPIAKADRCPPHGWESKLLDPDDPEAGIFLQCSKCKYIFGTDGV